MRSIPGLSNEMVERLSAARPETLDQAVARTRRHAGGAVGALRGGEPPRGRVIERLAQAAGRPVSRETFEKLEAYVALLAEENERQNLVSAATLDDLWERHILDSAQLVRFEPAPARHGSTSVREPGLPGIVIACLVRRPRDTGRAAAASRRISPQGRANRSGSTRRCRRRRPNALEGKFDVITARAVAALVAIPRTYPHICPQERPSGRFPRAASAQSELAEAQRRGKVRSTWNRASPTRIPGSSSAPG